MAGEVPQEDYQTFRQKQLPLRAFQASYALLEYLGSIRNNDISGYRFEVIRTAFRKNEDYLEWRNQMTRYGRSQRKGIIETAYHQALGQNLDLLATIVERNWEELALLEKLTSEGSTNTCSVKQARFSQLEKILPQKVIGQPQAVEEVLEGLDNWVYGLEAPPGFLFIGPSGVGKSHMAKTIADILFGVIERVECTRLHSRHTISTLIGSPIGYEGNRKPYLADKVKETPNMLWLFDELEKAHGDIPNVLLEVLEEGTMTTQRPEILDFRGTVIVATTNAGATAQSAKMGFGTQEDDIQEAMLARRGAVESAFDSALLGRFNVVNFGHLRPNDLGAVIDVVAGQYAESQEFPFSGLHLTEPLKRIVAKEGYSFEFGARPLKRAMSRIIKLAVKEAVNEKLQGAKIKIGLEKGKVKLKGTFE